MTSTKQAKTLPSFSERASIAVANKDGIDTSIPKILVFFEDKWKDKYLQALKEANGMKKESARSKIIALDTVLREIRITMADEYVRNFAFMGYCVIYSTRLDEEVIVCRDDMVAQIVKEEKKGIAVYTEDELEHLRGASDQELRSLHDAHTIFTGKFVDPQLLGKSDLRNYGTKKKARFGQAKKKNPKYARFKKSNPS
jgi:hypothetical protein|tara:strand:+ start:2283 stop:2876 length:594 start_codon:yes stop_codon:yes gene_type:complete